jgi:hypothetical protein
MKYGKINIQLHILSHFNAYLSLARCDHLMVHLREFPMLYVVRRMSDAPVTSIVYYAPGYRTHQQYSSRNSGDPAVYDQYLFK